MVLPVILCGGLGKRLWPLSTAAMPKPFHVLTGSRSLLQNTLLRCAEVPFAGPAIVVAHQRHADLVRHQAAEVGVAVHLVLECESHDSCAAALAGAAVAEMKYPGQLLAIIAADQHVPDQIAWQQSVLMAQQAQFDGFVLFGVKPRYAATEYGYVASGDAIAQTGLRRVLQFIEKPSASRAAGFVDDGWLWNSGNFVVRARKLLDVAAQNVPAMASDIARAVRLGQHSADSTMLKANAVRDWSPVSLDRAILEYVDELAVLPVDYGWSDVGTWDEVQRLNGGEPCFVHSNGMDVRIIGLDDVIVVSTPNGVLVTKRGLANELKMAVK